MMKHSLTVFSRFLAVFVVIFLGITAVVPQSTVKDDDAVLPIWTDINEKTDTDIIEVFKRGIITGGTDGEYGKNVPITASETAYASVRIYEYETGIDYSFNYYNAKDSEKYIKKAEKYNLWDERLPRLNEALTREEFCAVISKLDKNSKKLNKIKGAAGLDSLTYRDEVTKMYNLGIMIEENVTEAFSSEKKMTRSDAAELIMIYLEPKRRVKIVMPDYDAMEKTLTEKMSGWQGDWSLYFEDCKTGRQISINSHQVYSASLIKLFVAQTAYQKVADGKLAKSQRLEDEIRKMLTYSDNEAWKYLARALGNGGYSRGMAAVTETAQASGFSDTGQFYKGSHKNYNFTSVNDCGAYLRGLLNGTIVNQEYSEKILSLLKQQQHLHKIPSGIPDEVVIANKTGELDYMQGDAAIVYAPSGTYILVIIGDSLNNGYGQVGKFTELSKTVYEFLN